MSAALRLPAAQARSGGVARAVALVLSQMRLTHVRGSTVGGDELRGVSGGERKRTNIALELVASPSGCQNVERTRSVGHRVGVKDTPRGSWDIKFLLKLVASPSRCGLVTDG